MILYLVIPYLRELEPPSNKRHPPISATRETQVININDALKKNAAPIRNNVEEACPRCRCLISIKLKPDRGEDSDINRDDIFACVLFILFWLFSLLEIKTSYVLSGIVSFS